MTVGFEFWIWTLMTGLGYGQISETPTLFFLKYFDYYNSVNTVLSAIGLGKEYPDSRFVVFQELLQSMSDSLLGDVYLSANIQQVMYGESETIISFSVGDDDTIQQRSCGSTIIAFPPVPGDIDIFIPPKASQELQSLTSQIRTVNYYSILLADNDEFFQCDRLLDASARSSTRQPCHYLDRCENL